MTYGLSFLVELFLCRFQFQSQFSNVQLQSSVLFVEAFKLTFHLKNSTGILKLILTLY